MSKRTMIILCSIFAVVLLAAVLLPTLPGQEGPTDPQLSTKPTDPKPTDPKPTDPQPTDPKPTEPQPTEPQPTEPQPTEPQPTEPHPTEPHPTEPQPTEPKPDDKPGNWEDIMLNNEVQPSNHYYVAPNGSDLFPGTKDQPFKSLNHAKEVAAAMLSQVSGTITIHVSQGEYYLAETLSFDEMSFGDSSKGVVFKADGDVVISGGKQIAGWQSTTVNGISMYKTKVNGVEYIRQFYVNGNSQPRAALKGEHTWHFLSSSDKSAVVVDDVDLSNIYDPSALELKWKVEWKLFIHLAEDIVGDAIRMQQPYFKFTTSAADSGRDPNGFYFPNPNRHTVSLSNDLSFLDEPGEWYFDQKNGELYYYPAEGVDLSQATCVVPVLEELVSISGFISEKAQNITFDGFTFQHAAMNHISRYGLAINQYHTYSSGITTTYGGSYSSPYGQLNGNINLENTENVSFLNCTFRQMGGAALNIGKGAHHTTVQGCTFADLSDAAMMIGHSENSAASDAQKTMYTTISNNVIRRVGQDYTAMPAIAGYYAAYTQIIHNDIRDVPYSAITLGWGWGYDYQNNGSHNNVISFNRIDSYMQGARDGGGIYTLGAQPNSVIEGNYISNQGGPFGGIYLDEGSAYFEVHHNVVDNNQLPESEELVWLHVNGREIWGNGLLSCHHLTLHDNYTSNPRQSVQWQEDNCVLENNTLVEADQWPDAAKAIMDAAGLTADYAHLLP